MITLRFISAILLSIASFCAWGGETSPGMAAMAKANNETYRRVKELGPSASARERSSVAKESFAPARQSLHKDRAQSMQRYRNKAEAMTRAMEDDMARLAAADGKIPTDDMEESQQPKPVSRGYSAGPGTSSARSNFTTGEFGGKGTATRVQIRKSAPTKSSGAGKPKVIDGIIQ